MSFANIWLGLRDDANTLVIEYLKHDEESGPYSGPVSARAGRFFKFMADQDNVGKLYKAPTLGGNIWHLWNISFSDSQYTLAQIRAEIDWIIATYPAQVSIVGAWEWTGEQFGTEHVWSTRQVDKWVVRHNPNYQPDPELPDYDPAQYLRTFETVDEDYVSGYTGTPLYPIPVTQLLNFMPDVNEAPAVFLADVNLLMGQAPRSFFP